MIKILFNSNRIQLEEISVHYSLIEDLLANRLRYPVIKKLSGWKHQNSDLYRVKINEKARLICCFVEYKKERALYISAIHDEHNYNKLKRQLEGTNQDYSVYEVPTSEPLPEDKDSCSSFVPVIYYNNMFLELDESQKEGLDLKMPGLFIGPPGSGKTAVLYTAMMRFINNLDTAAEDRTRILFISSATRHLNTLKASYAESPQLANVHVEFSTWQERVQQYYPGLNEVDPDFFDGWVKAYFPSEPAPTIRYEMSLATILTAEEYLNLGGRQSHYFGKPEQQRLLIQALKLWQDYLKVNHLFDPICSVLPISDDEKTIIFCDETQNLPPVALDYFIKLAEHNQFVACLDSEQCLLTSPFIHNCLKELMHKHCGNYFEHILPRTWRCPPAIAAVANHLMSAKHRRLGNELRRYYKTVESALNPDDSGEWVSWISADQLEHLRAYGASPKTAVFVLQAPTEQERALINEKIGSSNILTAEEAIGLDFEVGILWKPMSQSGLHALKDGMTPTLEQIKTYNKLFVFLTRIQQNMYLCEPKKNKYLKLVQECLGTDIPMNIITEFKDALSHEEKLKLWQAQVDQHLSMRNVDAARRIMKNYLHMTEEEIRNKLNPERAAAVIAPSVIASPPSLPDEPSEAKDPFPKASVIASLPSSSKKVPEAKKPSLIMNESILSTFFSTEEQFNRLFARSVMGSCLFIQLINSEEWRIRTIDLLYARQQEHPRSCLKITVQHLTAPGLSNPDKTLLYHLLSTIKGLAILDAILTATDTASFINELSNHLLYLLKKPDATDLFTFFIKFKSGVRLLIHFLNNTELVERCALVFDKIMLANSNDIAQQASFLTFFCMHEESHTILRHFVKHMKHVNPEAWFFIRHTNGDTNKAGLSPFYLLLNTIEGIEVLQCLFDKNVRFIEITNAAFLTAAYIDKNPSIFYKICAANQGLLFLYTLLKNKPALIQGIDGRALMRALPANACVNGNTSALYWLAKKQVGRKILAILLNKRPALVKELTHDALFLPRTNQQLLFAKETPFLLLSSYEGGVAILAKLMEENSSLAEAITAEQLYTVLPDTAGPNASTSPFFWLLNSAAGCKILANLFRIKPALLDAMTLDILCLEASETDPTISPLALMTGSEAGRCFLTSLLIGSRSLAQLLKPERLEAIGLSEDISFSKTTYAWLVTPRGTSALAQLRLIYSEARCKMQRYCSNLSSLGLYADRTPSSANNASALNEEMEVVTERDDICNSPPSTISI